MAMKYTKVLELMKANGGRVNVDDAKLLEILGDYKAVGAMSDIRRLAKLEVRTIREGRKAVAYELVAAAQTLTETAPVVAADANDTPAV